MKKISVTLILLFFCKDICAQDQLYEAQEIVNQVERIKGGEAFKNNVSQVNNLSKTVHSIKKADNFLQNKKWINENKENFIANNKYADSIAFKPSGSFKIDKMIQNFYEKKDASQKSSADSGSLMIFVSFSMPKESLKNLAIQGGKSGVLVFKGALGGLRNMTEILQEVTKGKMRAIIDPRLFDSFLIKKVPTFVVINNKNYSFEQSKGTPRHDRISGNVSLRYALETIANGNGDASQNAKLLLNKLENE